MESAAIHSSEVHEVDSGIPMTLFKGFSTSLSLLQGELHLSHQASLNSLYDPFGSPCRGQKPQKEGCNRPTVLFFRKSPRPSLPLKRAPPLNSVFSPQGRRGKPPYSVLGTASL